MKINLIVVITAIICSLSSLPSRALVYATDGVECVEIDSSTKEDAAKEIIDRFGAKDIKHYEDKIVLTIRTPVALEKLIIVNTKASCLKYITKQPSKGNGCRRCV